MAVPGCQNRASSIKVDMSHKVLPDGRIILNLNDEYDQNNAPLISMTLFGRKFGDDGPPPDQWCPHGDFPPDSDKSCFGKRCVIN